jgi:putative ABC transport system ATP-binding protein
MEWQLSGGEVEALQRSPKITESEEIEEDLEKDEEDVETPKK